MKPAGIVLAAGASRRMGGNPKAKLEYQGETFLDRMVRLLGMHCSPVVVVVAGGNEAWVKPPALAAVNPDPDRGMLSSLQCGLERVGEAERILFTPVDLPQLRESTVAAVTACEGEIAIPRCNGMRGHPVAISRAVAHEMLRLDPLTAKPNDTIRADESRVQYVEVDDEGAIRDVDEPKEYRELLVRSQS